MLPPYGLFTSAYKKLESMLRIFYVSIEELWHKALLYSYITN